MNYFGTSCLGLDYCGGYDENMKWFWTRIFIQLLKSGGKAEVIKEPLYNYRRDGSTTQKTNNIKYELLNYIYLKHQVI
jgi:hypothetical protein